MGTMVPTLSSIGWIDTIEEKGDHVLSYFITSEYSQSVLYHGKISSLQWLVQRYGKNEVDLEREVTEILDELLTRYFGDDTEISVTVSERNPEQPGKLTIQLQCIVREGSHSVSLGRRVEFLNGKLANIAAINNG